MENKLFELMSKMYSEMKQGFSSVDKRFESVEKRLDNIENDIQGLKKDVVRLENDLKPKVEAALDGYKQHTDILERIETEVIRTRRNNYETYKVIE